MDVPKQMIRDFEFEFLEVMRLKHQNTLDTLKQGIITDTETAVLETVAKDISMKYKL